MFLFDMLFGKRKSAETPPVASGTAPASSDAAPSAPGTRIHHDAELIVTLKEDHGRLLRVFQEISAASRAQDLMKVQNWLKHFRTLIQDHLLKENVRLYVYLEHLLENDATSHTLMHGFRHEMDDIGRAVVGFLDKYKEIGAHPELASPFATDLAGVGEALVARIKREEEILYPMYSTPS